MDHHNCQYSCAAQRVGACKRHSGLQHGHPAMQRVAEPHSVCGSPDAHWYSARAISNLTSSLAYPRVVTGVLNEARARKESAGSCSATCGRRMVPLNCQAFWLLEAVGFVRDCASVAIKAMAVAYWLSCAMRSLCGNGKCAKEPRIPPCANLSLQ